MAPNSIALGLVRTGMICVTAAQMGVDFEMFSARIKSTTLVRSDKPENIVAGKSRA